MTPIRHSRWIALLVGLLLAAPTLAIAQSTAQPVVVVNMFPHDATAFTEGLEFHSGKLYEGTGRKGYSDLRKADLETGDVKRKKPIADRFFGEGITVFDHKIYQLTWQEHRAFVYRAKTWKRIKTFTYDGEGWGLTHNSKRLVMSNGTAQIVFRDPDSFDIKRTIGVTDGNDSVTGLNELEWVNGTILANIFPTNEMVAINPDSGDVTARYDLSQMKDAEDQQGYADVPNGIAYLRSEDRLFVTGKYWQNVYEITL